MLKYSMFKVTKKRNAWVMQIPTSATGAKAQIWENPLMVGIFDNILNQIVEEVKDRPGVRRTSYDTWHWTNLHELNRFITFYYLKYGKDFPSD